MVTQVLGNKNLLHTVLVNCSFRGISTLVISKVVVIQSELPDFYHKLVKEATSILCNTRHADSD